MILRHVSIFIGCVFSVLIMQAIEAADCSKKKQICYWKNHVVGIKTPMMVASGVIIEDTMILTNRHVVEDFESVLIRTNKGKILNAKIRPHNIAVDLVLLQVEKPLPIAPSGPVGVIKVGDLVQVVAFDQGRNQNRIYPSGQILAVPEKSLSQSRIHTNAKSLPGNSGGALVDNQGNLIGILASGDGEINEAIPISMLQEIKNASDIKYVDEFKAQGKAIRLCADGLGYAHKFSKKPDVRLIDKIRRNCSRSKNKQLLDQVGQTFGRWGMLEESIDFLKKSLQLDPISPNTLLSLAIAYHLDKRIEDEKPVLERLYKITPENPQALRLGIQVAGRLNDSVFGYQVLELKKKYNPNETDLAKDFLENALAN